MNNTFKQTCILSNPTFIPYDFLMIKASPSTLKSTDCSVHSKTTTLIRSFSKVLTNEFTPHDHPFQQQKQSHGLTFISSTTTSESSSAITSIFFKPLHFPSNTSDLPFNSNHLNTTFHIPSHICMFSQGLRHYLVQTYNFFLNAQEGDFSTSL